MFAEADQKTLAITMEALIMTPKIAVQTVVMQALQNHPLEEQLMRQKPVAIGVFHKLAMLITLGVFVTEINLLKMAI